MVKLSAPLHSLRASGKLGNAIQYASYLGRPFAAKKRNPKQPRTRPQRSARIFMGGMAKLWKALSQAQKDSWLTHAAAAKTSAYHAYLKENSIRYQKMPNTRYGIELPHAAPTAVWPATEDTLSAYFVSWTVTGLSQSVRITFDMNIARDNWLAMIHYADNVADYMRYDNLSAIHLVESVASYEIVIEDLPPGAHALRILPVSHTGLVSYDGYYKPVNILP